jgi:hypothetical protein
MLPLSFGFGSLVDRTGNLLQTPSDVLGKSDKFDKCPHVPHRLLGEYRAHSRPRSQVDADACLSAAQQPGNNSPQSGGWELRLFETRYLSLAIPPGVSGGCTPSRQERRREPFPRPPDLPGTSVGILRYVLPSGQSADLHLRRGRQERGRQAGRMALPWGRFRDVSPYSMVAEPTKNKELRRQGSAIRQAGPSHKRSHLMGTHPDRLSAATCSSGKGGPLPPPVSGCTLPAPGERTQ